MSANVFDLQGSISMDTSGFDKAIKDAVAEGKKLVQALSENTSQMKSLQDSVERARAQIDAAEKSMKQAADSASDMSKETKKSSDAVEDMAKEVDGLKSDLAKVEKATEDTADETKKLSERMDKAENEAQDLKTEVDRLGKEYDDNKKDANELENETNKLGDTVEKTEGKFSKFAEFMKNGFFTAIKVGAAAIGAAATAVVGYTKSAFDEYSAFEQNVGAMDKLFGDSSEKMKEYAKQAANTAGLSQNQYMDIANSFSGAVLSATGRGEQTDIDELKKTLDEKYETQKKAWDKEIKLADKSQKDLLRDQRDADLKRLKAENKAALEQAEIANKTTENTAESRARAVEITDMAIRDMSDLANTYSMTVEEVSDVYRALAKGEARTLDNLFGNKFAGTKEGLEDMLRYAEQYRASLGETVDYSADNFADIVSAIHDVSEAEGILGTTDKEAKGTLEGSTRALSAAYQNLKISIASGDIEGISESVTGLVQNVETVAKNAVPVITNIFTGIGTAVQSLAPVLKDDLPKLVTELLPPLVTATTSLVQGLVGALPGILTALTDPTTVSTVLISLHEMWGAIWNGIETIIAQAPDIIPDLLNQIGLALLNSVNILQKSLENIIYDLSDLIYKSLPVLIPIVLDLFKAILSSVATLSAALLPELADIFVQLFETLKEQDMADVVLTVVNALSTIFEAVADAGEIIAENLLPIITTLTEMLINGFEEHGDELQPALTDLLINLLKAVFFVVVDAAVLLIGGALTPLVNAVIALWEGVFNPLSDLLSDGLVSFEEWLDGIKEKAGDFVGDIIGKVVGFFEDLGSKFFDWKQKATEKVGEIVGTIADKITGLVNDAKAWGKDLIDNFLGGISDKMSSVGNVVGNFADTVASYIHFSEPDKGALADFHTFAPDMMTLFAQGIRDNADEVYREVARLTEGISTDLNAGVSVESTGGATAASTGGVYIYNTFSLEGVKIASDVDIEEMSDKAIQMISEKLEQLRIFDTRAYGGVVMP